MEIKQQDIETNGVRLHVAACGPEDGPLVILLHGFPEYWGAWRTHMGLLAEQGYRVIAPDQRGYNLSDKPRRIRDYRIAELSADIVGLIDHFGREQARIVGHDWGGAVAWHIAQMHRERVCQLVAINCPPADLLRRYALWHPLQLLRSWYVIAMQIPWLMVWGLSARNFALMRRTMRKSALPGTFDGDALSGHLEAWSQPNSLRSMINWYRAACWFLPWRIGAVVEVPVLVLWGERDRFLSKGLVKPMLANCRAGRAVRYPVATHWLAHEQTEAVVTELLEFFSRE